MTEPTLYPESGFRRLRMDIAYDGTNFSGWAIQPDRRTVQEVVETALSTVAQSPAQTIVAGRTDAGVHATGQVIHVDLPETLELDDLAYKLNRILDEDVRINKIEIAPTAFHARFSALRRYYEYRILDELIEHGGRFSALAIEFHDIDIHLAALERFISRFPLKLVHVHANNHALINGSRTPLVIECTFSASQPTGEPGTATLPHPLDMPNKRNRAEIAIRFE